MKRNKDFIIEVPTILSPKNHKNCINSKKENITSLKRAIQLQYNEIKSLQDNPITKENKKNLENLMLAIEDLISNCMKNEDFLGNRDENFINLTFIYYKLSLRMETYKLEEKIKELDNKSNIINKKQQELEDKQMKAEEKNNNLVYNLLSFLTAFSIVSATVEAIQHIQGTIKIMLFMAFTILILLTTLIALHNFYNNNKRENKLQDNYFLWKLILGIIIILCIIIGIQKIKDNKNNIFQRIDSRIENIIEQKIKE